MAVSADQPAWRVEITTSGGFAGQGAGNMAVAADGNLNLRNGCALTLTAGDLKAIRDLVAKAKAAQWKPSYVRPQNPNGCCDMIKTTVTLTRAGRKWTSTWFSDHDALPADLDALMSALWWAPQTPAIRERYESRCKP